MKLVTSVNFVNVYKTVFLAKLLVSKNGREVLFNTVFFRFSPEISPNKAENADFNELFGLIPFSKTDVVLDYLPESSY